MENNSINAHDWSSKTILIVEDDKFNAYIIENFIVNTKATIHKALSGEKAVEMAQSIKPDLILMDIKLPGLNGIEATIKIKEFLPDVIIIAQSAFVTESDKNEAIAAGCSEFLSKPIRRENLLNTISKFFLIQ